MKLNIIYLAQWVFNMLKNSSLLRWICPFTVPLKACVSFVDSRGKTRWPGTRRVSAGSRVPLLGSPASLDWPHLGSRSLPSRELCWITLAQRWRWVTATWVLHLIFIYLKNILHLKNHDRPPQRIHQAQSESKINAVEQTPVPLVLRERWWRPGLRWQG